MEKNNNGANWTKPYEILHNAEKFREAAQRLRVGVPENRQSAIVTPSCVCAALSIELYFKYLIFAKNNDLTELSQAGHKLDSLFEKVPPDWKNKILENIAPTIPNDLFIKTLYEFRDAFEIWRYEYEYNKVTTTTRLHEMADLLSVECKMINDSIPI